MGMLLTCSNKGCGAQDYHKLDKDSGEVLCASCGKTVEVTKYVKTSLLAQGQIMRKPKASLDAKCPSCNSTDGPILLKYSKTLFKVGCKKCKEVNAHLTKYFLGALRMKSDIEVFEVKPESELTEEELEPITKTAEGAVVVNKPFTASTRPADRKVPRPTTNQATPKAKPQTASQVFKQAVMVDEESEFVDGSDDRPKINVSKKSKTAAAQRAEALRQKFVDKNTGDVTEEMKNTIQINKV